MEQGTRLEVVYFDQLRAQLDESMRVQDAVADGNATVHLQPIRTGHDFGTETEVVIGIEEGATIIVSPGDDVREGAKVRAEMAAPAGRGGAAPGPGRR